MASQECSCDHEPVVGGRYDPTLQIQRDIEVDCEAIDRDCPVHGSLWDKHCGEKPKGQPQ